MEEMQLLVMRRGSHRDEEMQSMRNRYQTEKVEVPTTGDQSGEGHAWFLA